MTVQNVKRTFFKNAKIQSGSSIFIGRQETLQRGNQGQRRRCSRDGPAAHHLPAASTDLDGLAESAGRPKLPGGREGPRSNGPPWLQGWQRWIVLGIRWHRVHPQACRAVHSGTRRRYPMRLPQHHPVERRFRRYQSTQTFRSLLIFLNISRVWFNRLFTRVRQRFLNFLQCKNLIFLM